MSEIKTKLTDWDHLPDLELYMDQVLSVLARQQLPSAGEPELTASMINNYVKAGLLPRTSSKRYGKEHLSRLIIISALKSVLSVTELTELFSRSQRDPEALYEAFRAILAREEEAVSAPIEKEGFDEILSSAVKAALYKQKAKALLEGPDGA